MPTKERWAKMPPEEKARYAEATRKHQQENRGYWRAANRKAYLKKVGKLTNNMHHTEESRAQWHRDKANARCVRAKQARFVDEFTQFVIKEAHELRKLRNIATNVEWHVDHTIPLKGKDVCGLHIWNNIAVIPKVENLRKGNKNSIYA